MTVSSHLEDLKSYQPQLNKQVFEMKNSEWQLWCKVKIVFILRNDY